MKKLLYILSCLAVVFFAACSKGDDFVQSEGKGAVTLMLPVTRATVTDAEVLEALKVRVYSHNGEEQTLVRLYTYAEIEQMNDNGEKMWFVAGDYSITVEGGMKTPATFDYKQIYYYGSTGKFTLDAGADVVKEVKVHPKHTLIKVVFDESVVGNDAKVANANAIIAIADEFNIDKITSGEVAALAYNQTKVGYFVIDAEQESFVWNFEGVVPSKGDAAINKSGKYTPAEGFKPGYQYTITFKYSPDLPGYIALSVSVDKTEEDKNTSVSFKPEPQISGETYARVYEGMTPLTYSVKGINDLASLKITVGGEEYIYSTDSGVSSTNDGYFSVSQATEGSNLAWTVTLADGIINKTKAGEQTVTISATDSENVSGDLDVTYFGEGTFAMSVADAWSATATLKAYVNNDAASDVKIYYREIAPAQVSEWSVADAAHLSENVYVATAAGVYGGRQYEYHLSYGSGQKGVDAKFTTIGASIPNGDMETWSGNLPLCPSEYTSKNKSTTWDTGNHGSEAVDINVTTYRADVRPGSTGTKSAYLKSAYASALGIGKFAAGNIFYGRYVNTEDLTQGIVDFGQPFTYDYKPNKLTVWYKGNVGTINQIDDAASGNTEITNGGSDKAQIYVWLYDKDDAGLTSTGGRYKVRTKYPGTFATPDGKYVNDGDEGSTSHNKGDQVEGLIAYGYWNRTQSKTMVNGIEVSMEYNGWTKLEIPLVYVNDKKPNALVISCAASAYGDYFSGSTDSYMYVDDFEFVY